MKTLTKTVMTIEHHCLQLPYASLRLHREKLLDKLVISMERQGQIVPVVVVPKDTHEWVLIDGYLRVKALQRLGKDIIDAEIWNCDIASALLMLVTHHQSRHWEVIEEAMLLQELHIQHGLSQSHLAHQIGRDKSWVSRRLSLLEQLPDSIVDALMKDKLSIWSATRILAPLARAIPAHAELLLQYALQQPLSTRELRCFYEHYQRSNHQQRLRMVNAPDLFFKAQKLLVAEKQALALQAGLDGKWKSQLRLVRHVVLSLLPLASQLLTPSQEKQERAELVRVFHETKTQFDLLTQTIRSLDDAQQRLTTDDYQSAPKRSQLPCHQPVAENIMQHGEESDSGRGGSEAIPKGEPVGFSLACPPCHL
jgi:ParB/RepB/Spo0J family partition protein